MTDIREQAARAAQKYMEKIEDRGNPDRAQGFIDGYLCGYEAARAEEAAHIERLEQAVRVYMEKHELALQRAEAAEDALRERTN